MLKSLGEQTFTYVLPRNKVQLSVFEPNNYTVNWLNKRR